MRITVIAVLIAAVLGCAAATRPTPSTSISFELFPGTPGKPGFKSHELPVYAPPGKDVAVTFKAKKPIHAGVSGGTDYGILADATGAEISVRFKMIKFGEVRIYVSSVDGSADKVEAKVIGGSFPTGAGHWYFQKENRPDKAPEPTPGSVTPRATEGASK